MPISELPPGKPMQNEGVFDYTHLLPENLRKQGYGMYAYDAVVDDMPASHMIATHTTGDHKYKVGQIEGWHKAPYFKITVGEVDKEHREKGLGLSMYEAMLNHVSKVHGATRIKGGMHSTMVHGLHQKLAAKHGLAYEADLNDGMRHEPVESYDNRYAPYSYSIKSEAKVLIPGRYRVQYEPNLYGWMEVAEHLPAAMEQLGYSESLQKHIDAASRMLGVSAELPLKKARTLLSESDDVAEAVLDAFNANSEENLARLTMFVNDANLLKDEPAPLEIQSYKITPVRMEGSDTADAVQRAVDSGYINPVKLNGKHSKGSMLAKDPQTKVIWLLKPGSGKNSPALGVNEDPSSQSEREVAFWYVAKLLGIDDTFPRADLILVNGHQTAAMQLLGYTYHNLGERKKQDKSLPARILEPYRNNTTLFKWSLIDYILGNPDRHSQNIMVDPENKKVKLIDHGSAFAGNGFSPSEDDNSFIPYYLRAWTDKKFTKMTPVERMRYMPTLGGRSEQVFDQWVEHINEHHLAEILKDYNINPSPALARLAKLRAMPGPKWLALNKLWAGTI